jgi:hypothetical protein
VRSFSIGRARILTQPLEVNAEDERDST